MILNVKHERFEVSTYSVAVLIFVLFIGHIFLPSAGQTVSQNFVDCIQAIIAPVF